MKAIRVAVVACVLMLAVIAVAQEGPWFDPKGCAICSKFANEAGLWEHMHTEFLEISDGTVLVCHVDKEYQAAYQRAMKNAAGVIAELEAGKQLPLDGYCQAIGGFIAAGVRTGMYNSESGDVMILRSSDPAQVKNIKAFAKRTSEELARMAAPATSQPK